MSGVLVPKPMLGRQLQVGHPLARGLVGLWLFNEGSGNKVFDLSGNNPSGTIFGTTAWVFGKFGSSLSFFETSGNYVNANALQSVIDLPISANFSVVVWAAADTFISDRTAVSFEGIDDFNIYPYDDPDRVRIFWRDAGATIMVWNHSLAGTGYHQFVFVSYGLTDHRLFVDGIQRATSSADASNAGPFSNLHLGAFTPTSQNFHGQLGNVMIYNRALSSSEIASLYLDPFCIFKRDPIELWVGSVEALEEEEEAVWQTSVWVPEAGQSVSWSPAASQGASWTPESVTSPSWTPKTKQTTSWS